MAPGLLCAAQLADGHTHDSLELETGRLTGTRCSHQDACEQDLHALGICPSRL